MGELPSPPQLRSGEPELSSHNHPHPGEAQVVGGDIIKQSIIEREHAPVPPQPPTMANHAFPSQLDMHSPQTSYRHQGPYDMTPMTNALPPAVGYRPGQFPQGGHRYLPTTSPQMVQQMPQMPPYGGPPPMAVNQGFYVHQAQMSPYYGGGHMPPCQGPPPMPPRQNVAYYPNRMMMNHPQSAFYYAQPNPYPGQPQGMPVGMLHGNFVTGHPPNPDARKPRSSVDGLEMPLQALRQDKGANYDGSGLNTAAELAADESDNRQSTVRGPPRKPRQSGKAPLGRTM